MGPVPVRWSPTCSGSLGSTRSGTTCSSSGFSLRSGRRCPTSTSTSSLPDAPRSTPAIFERFGIDRVACVSMADTYRVRHAIRDVGAALGLPPSEIDTLAKAFPHIRARDAQNALRELPELRASRIADDPRMSLLFSLVERLDGLPRHLALHPCGVLLSDVTLLDRTPVEPSAMGFAMSQFDKDDVEHLGLLKLDVLGIRMQSAMAYALDEIERVDGPTTVQTSTPFRSTTPPRST